MSKVRLYDTEADNFLDLVTRLHCIVIYDVDTKTFHQFADQPGYLPLAAGLAMLADSDTLIAHNGLDYDKRMLLKLYPDCGIDKVKHLDTLVMSRLLYADIGSALDDKLRRMGKLPPKFYGKHSIEAWGHRLGLPKAEYTLGFEAWNPTMQQYCYRDVEVLVKLYNRLLDVAVQWGDFRSLDLEHEVAALCLKMEDNGFAFDEPGAVALWEILSKEFVVLQKDLESLFPPTIKKMKRVPDKVIPFNPGSRLQIEMRLKEKYGWKPTLFTDSGRAEIDDDILASLPYPEAQKLARYFLLEKRIGQIAEGKQAWLKASVRGFIHGRINPNGAVTGRATHFSPNIAQVPKAAKNVPFGKECRALFTVPPGWSLVGADMSGLELRCLAHFMVPYMSEGGAAAYIESVINGNSDEGTDVHTMNMRAAGLETRDQAKTFIYAFLYGAGDEKLGSIVLPHGTKEEKIARGKLLKARFLKGVPALASLKSAIANRVKQRGYLIGMDGRRLTIRSSHAALNTLLQSAGAIACKLWLLLIQKKLADLGLVHGWNGHWALCAWVHDEVQIAVKKGYEEIVGKVCREAAQEAGQLLGFRCPLDGAFKIGRNWAETH